MLHGVGKGQSNISILDLQLADIEGIGPAVAKKLNEAGYNSILELAVTSSEELALDADIDKDRAAAYIIAAHKLLRESHFLDNEFMTGEAVLERRRAVQRCSTGSNALDHMLYGGIETGAITEFFGEFGSGKSQICHTLCVLAKQPAPIGFEGNSLWIDTESTFRPERIEQIAKARNMNQEEILKSIYVAKVYNSSHLELVIKELGKYIEQFKVKLVIIDSIVALHRAEFAGRGTLAERQQRLNSLMHRLVRIGEIYNVAIIITNQVQSTPDTFYGDPNKPAGGGT
jgi:DNA repair protein RadA